MKWFDPLIAVVLAIPLGGALYIDYSLLTLGQKITWVLMGMAMGITSFPTTVTYGGAALPETVQAFAWALGGVILFRLIRRFRRDAKQIP